MQYSVADKNGELIHTFDPKLTSPSMMHDFAITENFSIIMDLPLRFDPRRSVKGQAMLYFNAQEKSKFGVFDRLCNAAETVKWFTADTCYIFHTANAWEHDRKVEENIYFFFVEKYLLWK